MEEQKNEKEGCSSVHRGDGGNRDDWTPEQVEDVYGDSTLEEALADRKSALGTFFDIIGKVINSK